MTATVGFYLKPGGKEGVEAMSGNEPELTQTHCSSGFFGSRSPVTGTGSLRPGPAPREPGAVTEPASSPGICGDESGG